MKKNKETVTYPNGKKIEDKKNKNFIKTKKAVFLNITQRSAKEQN